MPAPAVAGGRPEGDPNASVLVHASPCLHASWAAAGRPRQRSAGPDAHARRRAGSPRRWDRGSPRVETCCVRGAGRGRAASTQSAPDCPDRRVTTVETRGLTGPALCTTVLVRYSLMRLHSEDRSIVIRHQLLERIESRVESGGALRHQALPCVRALAGVLSASPEAVARAIEDLGRSGYRPLRPRPMAPDPASMRHPWDGGADRDAAEPHR